MGFWGYTAGALIFAGLLWAFWPRRRGHRTSTGLYVDCDDPVMAENVARAWESDKMVITTRDADGNITHKEFPHPLDSIRDEQSDDDSCRTPSTEP